MRRCGVWLILLLIVFGLSACTLEQRLPSDGVWYCEELQAQFYMGWPDGYHGYVDEEFPGVDETENYVIVNGDRIAAGWSNDRGSMMVYISCQEPNHPVYDLGEGIYFLEFVRLTDTEYVLKDDTGKHYTFVRIGDSPADD